MYGYALKKESVILYVRLRHLPSLQCWSCSRREKGIVSIQNTWLKLLHLFRQSLPLLNLCWTPKISKLWLHFILLYYSFQVALLLDFFQDHSWFRGRLKVFYTYRQHKALFLSTDSVPCPSGQCRNCALAWNFATVILSQLQTFIRTDFYTWAFECFPCLLLSIFWGLTSHYLWHSVFILSTYYQLCFAAS